MRDFTVVFNNNNVPNPREPITIQGSRLTSDTNGMAVIGEDEKINACFAFGVVDYITCESDVEYEEEEEEEEE